MKKDLIRYAVLSLIIMASCTKKEIVPEPTAESGQETFSSLESYLSSRMPQSESFQFLVESGGVFTTQKGTVITVPANVLITMGGTTVTGNVDMKFKEIFSNSDIIFSGVYPVSNGTQLNSGGEYYIEFSQNGDKLLIANGQIINVKLPGQSIDPGMMLFFANGEEDPDTLNWQLADSVAIYSGFTFNSADSSYSIDLDSVGWGNIDAFTSITYFDITFDLTGVSGLNSTNTRAYAVFKNENTVWPMGTESFGSILNNQIYEMHLGTVPMNVLVISVVNQQLYYGLLDVTPQQGVNYSIPLQSVLSSDLDQIINNLP